MSLTVGGMIDRILRNWLLPPDEQPVRFQLSAPLDASSTTLPLNASLMPPEIRNALSPGVMIELGREQILAGNVSPNATSITNCVRGVNGTTATPHASGALGMVAPPYSRQELYDAVGDAIINLYPTLYHLHTETFTTSPSPIPVAADFISPQDLVVLSGADVVSAAVRVLPSYPPSPTGKAVLIDAPAGLSAHLTYRTPFHRPDSESNLLFTDLGVEEPWYRIIETDVVAQVIASRDLEAVYTETLTHRLEAETFPPTSASRIHQTLLRYHEYLLERASRYLKARDGLPTVYNGWFSG